MWPPDNQPLKCFIPVTEAWFPSCLCVLSCRLFVLWGHRSLALFTHISTTLSKLAVRHGKPRVKSSVSSYDLRDGGTSHFLWKHIWWPSGARVCTCVGNVLWMCDSVLNSILIVTKYVTEAFSEKESQKTIVAFKWSFLLNLTVWITGKLGSLKYSQQAYLRWKMGLEGYFHLIFFFNTAGNAELKRLN